MAIEGTGPRPPGGIALMGGETPATKWPRETETTGAGHLVTLPQEMGSATGWPCRTPQLARAFEAPP